MEATFNVNAIILDKVPYKEHDIKLTIFSEELGKMELIARGAQKIRSKISGHIEPVVLSRLMVVRGKRLDYIGSAVGEEFYHNIKTNLDKIMLAGKALKLVSDMSREGEVDSNKYVFKILKTYLSFLDSGKVNDGDVFDDIFTLKFVSTIGFKPNLSLSSEACNNFDLELGALVKVTGAAKTLMLSDNCINLLNKVLIADDFEFLHNFKIEDKLSIEFSGFVRSFLAFNVPDIVKQVNIGI